MSYTPENGDVWIDSSLSEVKYKINDKSRSLHPTPWYVCGEAIPAGRLVSMCDTDWAAASGKTSGLVYLSDSAYIDKAIGIALNTTTASGQAIEVLSWGVYNFGTAKFDSSEVGKMAYVKVSPDGDFTTNRNDATIGGNKLISVGTVVSTTELLISFQGDSRGPTGITEIEYTLGESVVTDSSVNPKLACQAFETSSSKVIGRVYLADRRKDTYKTTIAGFIIGSDNASFGTSTPLPSGTKVICQRQGLVDGFTGLIPGEAIYADTNGAITQNIAAINFYTDALCPVGIAYSSTQVLVNIESSIYNVDSAPVGSIIALPPTGTPDYGYLVCNGSALNAVTNTEYQELYDVIGNTWGGTNNTNFELPNLSAIETTGFQIKYKVFYQAIPPSTVPVFRVETDWATYNSATSYQDVNINAFGEAYDLDESVVKIFIKSVDGTTTRCIEPSTSTYTYYNAGYLYYKYGYQAEKLSSNPDYIRIKFASNGLAYQDDSGVWQSANGWYFKIVIYKAEKWNRFFDITAEDKLNTLFAQGLVTRNKTTTTKNAGEIDRGVVDPTNTTRLNYDGWLYATLVRSSTNFSAKGKEVVLSDASVTDAASDASGIRVKGASDKTLLWKDADDSWHSNQGIRIDGSSTNRVVLDTSGNAIFEGNEDVKGISNFEMPSAQKIWAHYSANTQSRYPDGIVTTGYSSTPGTKFLDDSSYSQWPGWTATNGSITNSLWTVSSALSYISKTAAIDDPSVSKYLYLSVKQVGTILASALRLTFATGTVAADTYYYDIPLAANYDWQEFFFDTTSLFSTNWSSHGAITALRLELVGYTSATSLKMGAFYVGDGTWNEPVINRAENGISGQGALTINKVVAIEGFKDRAFKFNTALSSSLVSATADRGFTNSNFSINTWFYNNSPSGDEYFIDYGDSTHGFSIRHRSGNSLRVTLKDASSPVSYDTSASFITAVTWTMLTFVFNRSGNQLLIYKNGVLAQTTSISFPAGCTNIDGNGYNLTLGGSFNGALEDIKIFNDAISLSNIRALYYVYSQVFFTENSAGILVNTRRFQARKVVALSNMGVIGTQKETGTFYAGSVDPTNSTRLNFDGYLYATRVYNAIWNDIADFVQIDDPSKIRYGRVFIRDLDGKVKVGYKHAQKGTIGIASDTYGLAAGVHKDYLPIAVAGWVLAYVENYKNLEPGDELVCSKNGMLEKATLLDKIFRPTRIIAIYDRPEPKKMWPDRSGVAVKGRCWVKATN